MISHLKFTTITRIAGLTYIIVILLGVIVSSIIMPGLIDPGYKDATFGNISANELLFRVGITGELVMYFLVIVLSWSLYELLKNVDKNLAMLALLLRTAEAIIGAALVIISGLIPLRIIAEIGLLSVEQTHSLIGLFLDTRVTGLDIVLLFVGAGGTIFLYLFYKSGYVPKLLAGWGIFTYLLMFLLSILSLLFPEFPAAIKMVFFTPGALFELFFGFWLLVKGRNIIAD